MEWNPKPKWVVRFYNVFGKKIQPAAEKIRAFDFPPKVHLAMEQILDILPEIVGKMLLKEVTKYNKKFGSNATRAKINKTINALKNIEF